MKTMRRRERIVWVVLVLALFAALLLSRARPGEQSLAAARPRSEPGVRVSMNALHQEGGLPLGWQMTLPPGDVEAGRRTFVEMGCHSCHRVEGEPFAADVGTDDGPDLSGMGSHHPPVYFAEAILNPDAVLIDSPNYIGADGHSRMPTYPEMTAGQLADLVAYLSSLKQAGAMSCHDPSSPASAPPTRFLDLRDEPKPEPGTATRYFVQTYDVLPGRLEEFEKWFAEVGKLEFLSVDGLLSVDSFVDATRPSGSVTTIFAFRDEAALRNFLGDPGRIELWKQFDAFVGPHGHRSFDQAPVYRAPALSAGS